MVMSIEKLKREHRRMEVVLEFAESELSALERSPDACRERLHQALDYLRHYFDQVHHPHEDVLFDYVEARRCDAHEAIEALSSGHEAMYRLGSQLDASLDRLNAASDPPDAEFYAVCRRYLAIQRENLELEEEVVFPLADGCLSESDWQAIGSQQSVREPVMADSRASLRFGALYEFLMDSPLC